jgi:hypothetical protein
MRLRMVLVVPLVLAAGGIFGLFWATHRGMSVTTTESTIADYADELRAIGARKPIAASSQKDAPACLADVKADIGRVEKIARGIEQRLTTKSSACAFAKVAGDKIEKEIPAAASAIENALDGLFSETTERYQSLTEQNAALGWVGWRGSRETEIQEFVLFAHDIVTITANADLAFERLRLNESALNKVASTCDPP